MTSTRHSPSPSGKETQSVDVMRYGPWAVITGASDGIGRAIAARLAAQGFALVLVARRADVLHDLAARWEQLHGISTLVVAADLSLPTSIEKIAEATSGLNVGLVVLAAGFGSIGPFCAAEARTDTDMITVNIAAVTALAHVFGPRLARRGHGALMLFGSIVGWQGGPLLAVYAATKAYNQSLAEALRAEWRNAGIDVLAVAPGPVHSGFAGRAAMTMTSATTADVVARSALAALGRGGTVIPGPRGKLLTYGLLTAPRALRIRIMARIASGMHAPSGRGAS